MPRHFLTVLSTGPPTPLTKGSGRLELADIIATHPLSARVIVNRIWKGHFGTGIVDTPSNFGANGEAPTNPALLEYLAATFVEHGRSLKQLHRAIMLSAVYQLGDEARPANVEKDAGNRLYWRGNRRRMTAEQIRDSTLAVSGALDSQMGGPSEELTPDFNRRTIYGKVSRYKLDQFLQLFDFPAATISAEQRFSTSVPLQRLFFMNSDFIQQQGELLARRVAGEPDVRARVRKASRLILGRVPSEPELAAGLAYLEKEPLRAVRGTQSRGRQGTALRRHDRAREGRTVHRRSVTSCDDRRWDDGRRGSRRGRQKSGEAVARDADGPIHESAPQFERVPVHRLRPPMAHKGPQPVTRREALCRMGSGFGMMAFAGLVGESLAEAHTLADQAPVVQASGGLHHPARAKHVIFLFMNGGLSQVDSFDPKPMLDKYHGQPLPGGSIATERKTGVLMRSPFTFKKYGQMRDGCQ